MRQIIIALGLFSFLNSPPAVAKILYFGSESETLTLAYGGATLLRFPRDVKTISQAAKFIIVPADQTQPDYSLLAVTPRFTKGQDRVTFVLSDGEIINTKLVVVPRNHLNTADSFYDLKSKESLIEQEQEDVAKISEIELLKAMARGATIRGYNIKKLSRKIHVGVSSIHCQLVRIYSGKRFSGYVFRLQNYSRKKTYKVHLERLTLGKPNQALLSQVDSTIGPKNSESDVIYLRVVAKPTSQYTQIKFPIEKLQKKKP